MDSRQKIVILEDDEIFAALLAETLGEYYTVQIGHSGLHGIAMCLEGGVAAVVTEIVMPDLDGIQMLTEFKKNPALSSIPVLVVTATDFTGYSRSDVESFPQVRGIFYKTESVDIIVEAVKQVLKGG